MDVSHLRFYAEPFTAAESSWPADVRRRMKQRSQQTVMKRLGWWRMPVFAWHFAKAHKFTKSLDLSELRARGLDNDTFIHTQLEYLAFFIAIKNIVGSERAVEIAREVMEASAYEPMLLCLPPADDVRATGQPFEVMTEYMRAMPAAGEQGGSHVMSVTEDSPNAFEFDVMWCVWLELAKLAGVPEACIPNCHADDLVFPDYFGDLDISYKRTKTLACGGDCCDFRFERGCSKAQ